MISGALGQDTMVACPSQEQLEQVLQSDGSFVPDDCRELTVNQIDAEAGRLCVMDFEAPDPGVIDQLTDAATTTQWWVNCDDLR